MKRGPVAEFLLIAGACFAVTLLGVALAIAAFIYAPGRGYPVARCTVRTAPSGLIAPVECLGVMW